jgi:hypothetical protein
MLLGGGSETGTRSGAPGDSTPMMPQPTFIENGADPENFGEVWYAAVATVLRGRGDGNIIALPTPLGIYACNFAEEPTANRGREVGAGNNKRLKAGKLSVGIDDLQLICSGSGSEG